jgi:hypothetical protein
LSRAATVDCPLLDSECRGSAGQGHLRCLGCRRAGHGPSMSPQPGR